MISYFKYTNGEAFTLSDMNYTGFFTVVDGNAYTGKKLDENSELLTPKENFITDFYLRKMEFDNQSGNIENIDPYFSNSFDVLNKTELDKIFDIINKNNLIVFKSLFIQNPQIMDFDENDCHFYGLSTSDASSIFDDFMNGKKVVVEIEEFSNSTEWSFLDNIKYGDFVVKSDESFKYLCSTGTDLILIKGSFTDTSVLIYNIEKLNFTIDVYGIHYDDTANKLYVMIHDELLIYEGLNFIECDNLILIDSIKLKPVETTILKWGSAKKEYDLVTASYNSLYLNINQNNEKYFKLGNKLRTHLSENTLTLYNKNDDQALLGISLSDYNIEKVIAIDIRNIDDAICLLHYSNNEYQFSFFDPYEFESTFKNYTVFDIPESDVYTLKFSSFDSNIVFLCTRNKVESRFISNPSYAASNFREFGLKYPQRLKWGSAFRKYDKNKSKWNLDDSNYFTNINFKEISRGNKTYSLLHNSGRLYALKHPIIDTYQASIDRNTLKYFKNIKCGNDSFGVLFNKELFNMTKDMLTLHTKAINAYRIKNDDVLLNKVNKIEYDLNNLRMNGNESVNTVTMQRIFTLIVEIQEKLIANLVTEQ